MKLIRDKLADMPWEFLPQGKEFVRPVADKLEHVRLLKLKLLEECGELMDAGSSTEIRDEAADLLQVVEDYLSLFGIDMFDAEAARDRKFKARGGFARGTVWDI